MLNELRIQNFAVIQDASVNIGPGLTVISGEEGSGKSLIVDALSLLMGTRANPGIIRNGTSTARVEGIFWLMPETRNKINSITQDSDIQIDNDGMLIISRELQQQGRSIARINNRAVPLSLLRQIGQNLIDIHGQMDYMSLLDPHHQIDLLDSHSDLSDFKNILAGTIDKLRTIQRELSAPINAKTNERRELLQYQIEEIERASLNLGEDQALQEKHDTLTRAEALKESCLKAYDSLYGDDHSATVLIHEALTHLRIFKSSDPTISTNKKLLEDVTTNLEDAARELRRHGEMIESDSSQLEELERRIGLLNSLKRKYGATIEDIFSFLANAQSEFIEIQNREERHTSLQKEIGKLELEAGKMAEELSLRRRRAAKSLTELVNEELAQLGLPLAKFDISLQREEDAYGLPTTTGKRYTYTREGIDHIEFMITTNPGEPLRPLNKIASGGETCRIMLAVKSALKRVDPIPTLVFDEIDASVGGRSGETMGKKLAILAKQHQVLCITHLPQIACFGDNHIKLTKDTKSGRSVTKTESMVGQSRIMELAAMLGSHQAEKSMIESANKLIRKAQTWKERDDDLVTV